MSVNPTLLALCACLGWFAGMAAAADSPETGEVARARAAAIGAIRGRLGADVRVDLDGFVCRLDPDAPETLTATPDLTARTGVPMRFTFAAPAGAGVHALRVGEATAVVRVAGPHVQAARPVEAGRTLTPDDVAMADGPIEGSPLRRLVTLEDVIGARTIRALRPGDPVLEGAVAGIPMVRAGDRVRATVRGAGVEVAIAAVAEQNGMPDQIIRVVNPDSRRAVRARVVAKGEVEVLDGR